MNTIEYRVDCQLLQYLHWENALGCRFPIGKTDQVCAVLVCVGVFLGDAKAGRQGSWSMSVGSVPIWLVARRTATEAGGMAQQALSQHQPRHGPAIAPPLPHPAPTPRQVEKWERAEIMSFWARHYFPANATLYVVGDIDVQVCSQLGGVGGAALPGARIVQSSAAQSTNLLSGEATSFPHWAALCNQPLPHPSPRYPTPPTFPLRSTPRS